MIQGLADFDLWTHEYFIPDVISNGYAVLSKIYHLANG